MVNKVKINIGNLEAKIMQEIPAKLAELLPEIRLEKLVPSFPGRAWDLALKLRVGSSSKWLRCEVKSRGEPWYLYQAIGRLMQAEEVKKGDYPVVIVPFISQEGKKVCQEAGVGYLDFSGNVFLKFDAVLIEKSTDKRKVSERRAGAANGSPFSPKASRVLRVLLENPSHSWTFSSLSRESQVNIRQVYSVVEHIKDKGWLAKKRGAMTLVAPGPLMDYWAENYRYATHDIRPFFSFARNLEEFLVQLRKIPVSEELGYALTLHAGAGLIAPFVRFSDIYLYVKGEVEQWTNLLQLKPVETGGSLFLMLPRDDGVFYRRQTCDGVSVACFTQLYLDLYNFPGRGREQAEFLRKQKISF